MMQLSHIAVLAVLLALGCAEDPAGDEVLRFDFEGADGDSVSDLSGQGNDGNIIGGRSIVDGRSGDALDFDGGGVNVSWSSELTLTDALTFEMWVRPGQLNESAILISDQVTGNVPLLSHELSISSMGITFSANTCTEIVNVRGRRDILVDTWTHVAATWDGDEVRIYQDAELLARNSLSEVCPTENDLRLGRTAEGERAFRGALDDVIISSYAKSEGQILETVGEETGLYGCTVSRKSPTSSWFFLALASLFFCRRRRR